MNELYKELLKYLDDNFIEYKELGDFILEINNQTFELFEPVKWDENDSILLMKIFVGQVIKQTVITTFFHLEVYGGI